MNWTPTLTISGAPSGVDAQILFEEAQKSSQPVIFIARDGKRLEAMEEALRVIAPQFTALSLPAWDCLPYDRVSPHAQISAQRLWVLSSLASGTLKAPMVILTTINAASQKMPPRSVISSASFTAQVGKQLNEKALFQFFEEMGFDRTSTVMSAGEYAVRGGIIDLFAPGHEAPIRLDLFGDVLDAARLFDPDTQRTTQPIENIELAPVCEAIVTPANVSRFRQNYRINFGAAGSDDPLYEAISAGRRHQGLEHWLPLFYERLETVFDYLPEASVIFDTQCAAALTTRSDQIHDYYQARIEALETRQFQSGVYKPVPPESLYLDPKAFAQSLARRRTIQLEPAAQSTGLNAIDKSGRPARNFLQERQDPNAHLFRAVVDYINSQLATRPVVIASYSNGAIDRLQSLLADEGFEGGKIIEHLGGVSGNALHFTVWALEQGYVTPELVVISEQDILGDRLIGKKRKSRKAENFIAEASALNLGDLVVHVDHGIGRYLGLEVIVSDRVSHECLVLEYAEDARLFLPIENIELLSRYGGEDGHLDRLGGGAWQAKKAKIKQRIKEMAERLMNVAAARALRKAPLIDAPDQNWESFCARFPYVETEDQLSAIEDVVNDFASGIPMDRLICGDVGFGKTEVAMRAAFLAASSGLQVALVAPTTLLARQHAQAFQERFRGFAINIRPLSRFVSAKDANATREGLEKGGIDIVIGTHAVLAKSVKFSNLGLVIIDEEQRFGVAHKERLKELRNDVHVLTLSATPIPRTLQMSLTGVRDLSIIATPPVDRLPVRTFVGPFDHVTIREVLLREHYRGGQSFFVVPRVQDIKDIEAFLKETLPELTYVVVHGQLAAGDLDNRMNAFYDGKYDVLLATTIIESGLDIPAANTMVIHRADQFGLAQLYQLRGRVGRSKLRAFAYLTTKPNAKLTPTAEKRLSVISALEGLGAGFNLASQDLDIRGAGNILGDEQSGQMPDVGFELYQSMLEEAIAKLKSTQADADFTDNEQWAPQINLGVSVLIPESYVPDLNVRLSLYRRLSALSKRIELEGFCAELVDRFGPLPKEVHTLTLIVQIKSMCKRAKIAKLDGGPKGATIQFHNDKFPSPEGLIKFLEDQRGLAKIKGTKLIVRRDWKKDKDRIKGAHAIAKDLARFARNSK